MTLPYRKIFKQAYEISRNNKFLWIFGLFLSFGSLLNFSWKQPANGQNVIQLSDLASVAVILAALLLIILYFRAKTGLIIAIKAILDRQETSPWRAFLSAGFFFNRILIVSILIESGLILLGLVLGGPVAYMFSRHFTYRAIVLLVLASAIFIPVAVVAILVNVLTPMFVVIFDLKIREAIGSAFDLIFKNKIQLLIFGLLLFLVELLPLFLASIMIGLHQGLTIVLLTLAAFLIVQSAVAVFQQSAWVLAFLELVKPQELEEEPLPVPEIVS